MTPVLMGEVAKEILSAIVDGRNDFVGSLVSVSLAVCLVFWKMSVIFCVIFSTAVSAIFVSIIFSTDFSSALVLKDRFGAGGNHVYKIARNFSHRIQNLMSKNPEVQFVLQPFLAFDHGYTYQNRHAPTDLRLIFHSNQLLQSYIRIAQPQDFRCNEHQGGELIYVDSSAIPASVHTIANQIVQQLNLPGSLYALDFLVSNSGHVYFVEGNTGPGLDWDITKKLNEQKSKQLIRSIVSRFTTRLTA